MRGPLPLIVARRVVALAATVVIAPTFAYVVFGALADRLGQPAPAAAWDYAVTTFWHFDLGVSGRFNGPMNDVVAWTFPLDVTMVFGSLLLGMGLGVAAGLVAVARSGTLVGRGLQGLAVVLLCCPPYFLPFMLLILFAPGVAMPRRGAVLLEAEPLSRRAAHVLRLAAHAVAADARGRAPGRRAGPPDDGRQRARRRRRELHRDRARRVSRSGGSSAATCCRSSWPRSPR
jgi:ABC-type dipeptide/oligopeptide/nickel transport system permease component